MGAQCSDLWIHCFLAGCFSGLEYSSLPPQKVSGGIVKGEVFVHSIAPHWGSVRSLTFLQITGQPPWLTQVPSEPAASAQRGDDGHRPGCASPTGTVPRAARSRVGLGLFLQSLASAPGKASLAGNLDSLMMPVTIGRSHPDQVGQVGHPAGKKMDCTVKTHSFRTESE